MEQTARVGREDQLDQHHQRVDAVQHYVDHWIGGVVHYLASWKNKDIFILR